MARPDTGTRQKLIDTASDLLWTSSYGAVSVDDICKAAGVKKGSFYHYFPSKQALAVIVMEEYYEQFMKVELNRIFAANKSFTVRMQELAQSVIKEQTSMQERYGLVCGCPLAALGSENIGSEHQEISTTVTEMFDRCKVSIRTALVEAMESGLIPPADAYEKTEAIHDFITGLMMMARIHNSLDGLERDLEPGLFRIVGLAPDITIKDTVRRT